MTNKNTKLADLYILTSPLDIQNKIVIDIKEIIDFGFCPFYHDIKKNDNGVNLRNLYDISIHRTFYSYLRALQEDRLENTLEFLKYQWGKEWIKQSSTNEILITPSSITRDTHESKRKKGIDAIFTFDSIMSKDKQYPIIIGHKYQIEIIPNVILTGTFEYIRELTVKDQKIIQLVKFQPESDRFSTNISQKYNMELIAASYAFKELFSVNYFQSVLIDITKKKIKINTYYEKEYNILKQTIKNIIICIQNNIKFVSPDTKCYCCEYRNVCINKL